MIQHVTMLASNDTFTQVNNDHEQYLQLCTQTIDVMMLEVTPDGSQIAPTWMHMHEQLPLAYARLYNGYHTSKDSYLRLLLRTEMIAP